MEIIVTNKVRIGKCKPGEIREKFKSRAAFENWKAAQMLFVKGGTTEENFKRAFNVDYCSGTQMEIEFK